MSIIVFPIILKTNFNTKVQYNMIYFYGMVLGYRAVDSYSNVIIIEYKKLIDIKIKILLKDIIVYE